MAHHPQRVIERVIAGSLRGDRYSSFNWRAISAASARELTLSLR